MGHLELKESAGYTFDEAVDWILTVLANLDDSRDVGPVVDRVQETVDAGEIGDGRIPGAGQVR